MVEYPKQKTKDYTKQLFFAFVLVMIPTYMFHTIMGFSACSNAITYALTVVSSAVIVQFAYYNISLYLASRGKKGAAPVTAKTTNLAIFAVNTIYLAASFLSAFVAFKDVNTPSKFIVSTLIPAVVLSYASAFLL